jgi:hypothetical protein
MEHLGATIAGEAIARASRPAARDANQAGESTLNDRPLGTLARGDQFAVQPHNPNLIRGKLTGR